MEQWKKDAYGWANCRLEYIFESHETPDFIEFVGEIGGDILRYRYYKSGAITEK